MKLKILALGIISLLAFTACSTATSPEIPEDKSDLITVSSPTVNETVASPIKLKGEARGNWYFEASFPVKLADKYGNNIATGVVQAQDNWMTEEFVPFEMDIPFVVEDRTEAILILEKSNPSGLEENADQLEIPVILENK